MPAAFEVQAFIVCPHNAVAVLIGLGVVLCWFTILQCGSVVGAAFLLRSAEYDFGTINRSTQRIAAGMPLPQFIYLS